VRHSKPAIARSGRDCNDGPNRVEKLLARRCTATVVRKHENFRVQVQSAMDQIALGFGLANLALLAHRIRVEERALADS